MATGQGRHRRPPTPTNGGALARAAGVTAVGAAIPVLTAGTAHAAAPGVWEKVAACESSGDWAAATGNGYSGGLQFSASTWSAYGGDRYASSANLATESEQIAIAQRVLRAQGPGAWPVCSVRAGLTRADGGATADPVGKTPAAPAAAHKASAEPSTRPKPKPKSKKEPKPTSTPKKSTPKKSTAKKQLELKPSKEPKQQPQPARAGAKTVRHTVRTGETLSGIAEQLGVPGGWQPLYAQNRATVGADPNLILPGEQLSWTGDVAPAAPVAGLPTFARSIVHHADVDLAAPVGTPVQAVAAGTVVLASWAGDDGNLVKVRHPGGEVSRYAHLSRFDVRVGEQVTAGATVGLSGATGKVGRPRLRVQLDATGRHGSTASPGGRPADRGVTAV